MKPNPAKPKPERKREERQDWTIVLVILLLGLCCVAGAGQYALRLAPDWRLDADMGSNLDLNSEFLTSKPIAYFEPIDPAILTLPAWVSGNVFLTPGAGDSFVHNRTPLPTSDQDTPIPTVPGTIPVGTMTPAVTTSPTNTLIWIPVRPTRTSRPGPVNTPTNTSPPSAPDADLWITKTSATNSYSASGTVTYTVTVGNDGPSAVTGAVVRDTRPSQIASWSWACTGIIGAATGCDPGTNANFTDSVNLASGARIQYTVTATISGSPAGDLLNTAYVDTPAGYTETDSSNNEDDCIHTLTVVPLEANLWITKTDNATDYVAGGSTIYYVEVGNSGPSPVTGVRVQDTLPGQITLAATTWTCGSINGGSCTASGSENIDDSAVNLPVGSSVVYRIVAPITGGVSGDLVNQAYASLPVGYAGASPVQATDTDTQVIVDPVPGGMAFYDGNTTELLAPSTLTLPLGFNVVVDGNGDWDLIYYEREWITGGIRMDKVILQIGNGSNWYTILNWGNASSDTNTEVALPVGGWCPAEIDNCVIPAGVLYNNTGVRIDVDSAPSAPPPGTYSYIRITVPAQGPGDDTTCGIDAIVPYP